MRGAPLLLILALAAGAAAQLAPAAWAGGGGGGWVRLAYSGGGLEVYEAFVPVAGGGPPAVAASTHGPGVAVGGYVVLPLGVVELGDGCVPLALAADPLGSRAIVATGCGDTVLVALAAAWGVEEQARAKLPAAETPLAAGALYRDGGFYALVSAGSRAVYAAATLLGFRLWELDGPWVLVGDGSPVRLPKGLPAPLAMAASAPSGRAYYESPEGAVVADVTVTDGGAGFAFFIHGGVCGAAPGGTLECVKPLPGTRYIASNGWAELGDAGGTLFYRPRGEPRVVELTGYTEPAGLAGPYVVAAAAGGGRVDILSPGGDVVYSMPVRGNVSVASPTGLAAYVVDYDPAAGGVWVYIVNYAEEMAGWEPGRSLAPLAAGGGEAYYLAGNGGVEMIDWEPGEEPPPPGIAAAASIEAVSEVRVRLSPAGYWLARVSDALGTVSGSREFILIHGGGYTLFQRAYSAGRGVYSYSPGFNPETIEAVAIASEDAPPFPYRLVNATVEAASPMPAVVELVLDVRDARLGGIEPQRLLLAAVVSPEPLPPGYRAAFTCGGVSVEVAPPPGATLYAAPLPGACSRADGVEALMPVLGTGGPVEVAVRLRATAALGLAPAPGGGYVLASGGLPVEAAAYVAQGPSGEVSGTGALAIPWEWGDVYVEAWGVRLTARTGGATITVELPRLAFAADLGPPPSPSGPPEEPRVEVPWWLATGAAAGLGVVAACALLWRYSLLRR